MESKSWLLLKDFTAIEKKSYQIMMWLLPGSNSVAKKQKSPLDRPRETRCGKISSLNGNRSRQFSELVRSRNDDYAYMDMKRHPSWADQKFRSQSKKIVVAPWT
mmetsp:Transcript_4774/g.10153  ORF Transcript_4774/g.10153 Transcript_4774/m.10153 type:complete len:104 (-) Transcript_4774:995-1306(-)